MKVPQQKNDFDCGLFLLYFVQLFAEAPFPVSGRSELHRESWFNNDKNFANVMAATLQMQHELRREGGKLKRHEAEPACNLRTYSAL